MLRLHVFNTGWASVEEKQLYIGGSTHRRTVPVLAFVIEHPNGFILFDTGLHPAFATHARQYMGWLGNPLLPFRSSPGMNLSTQMRAKGLPPEEVRFVVLSHLHYDHTGELRAFPQAELLLTRPEWQAAQSPLRRFRGYLDKEYHGLAFSLVDFPTYDGQTSNKALIGNYGLDLLKDGSLILVPTVGHSHGHQSLLVFLPYGVVLLAGDAVYVCEGYTKPANQPRAHLPESAWRSLIGLRALAKGDPNALILPTHDDSALRGLQRPDIVMHSPMV
ncbi:MAG: N-acyl homoserine lactonase family protein [Candidatus Hadarchaeum sp.]